MSRPATDLIQPVPEIDLGALNSEWSSLAEARIERAAATLPGAQILLVFVRRAGRGLAAPGDARAAAHSGPA